MSAEQKQAGFWSNLGLLQSKNKSDCSQSVFKKNSIFFMLSKEQNNSNQSCVLIGPIGFLSISKLMYLFSLLERLWSFSLLKTMAYRPSPIFFSYFGQLLA